MKTINKFRDLEAYGIIPLTGEADSLSYRILCDLTHSGRQLVAEAFGLANNSGFAENWNHGSASQPHCGSIMLSVEAISQIAPIALIRDCHTVFVNEDGTHFGMQGQEEFKQAEWEYVDDDDENTRRRQEAEKTGDIWTKAEKLVEKCPPMYRSSSNDDWQLWPQFCYGKIRRYFVFGTGPRIGTRNTHAMTGRTN